MGHQLNPLNSEHVLNYNVAMSSTTFRAEFQSSELSRNSSEVFSAAEQHPIRVTRRNAEPLVMMSEREQLARDELFEFAATLIAVTTDDSGPLEERMSDRLPWMLALTPADRAACATDLVQAARASFATQQPHLLMMELTSWQETASAVAAGLANISTDWVESPVRVKQVHSLHPHKAL